MFGIKINGHIKDHETEERKNTINYPRDKSKHIRSHIKVHAILTRHGSNVRRLPFCIRIYHSKCNIRMKTETRSKARYKIKT